MKLRQFLVLIIACALLLNTLSVAATAENPANDYPLPENVQYVGGVVSRGSESGIATFAITDELELAYALTNVPYIVLETETHWSLSVSGGTAPYTVKALLACQTDLSLDPFEDDWQGVAYFDVYDMNFDYTFVTAGRYFWEFEITDRNGEKLIFQTRVYETYTVADETNTNTVAGKVNSIVASEVTPGMSDYTRALVLHDWLIYNANYDYTYTYYDASGVLLHGTGVCDSYARAYLMLMTAAGVECVIVSGMAGSDENGWESHAWNMVKLDGTWYHVDCTWDDPNKGGCERHTYFCVSDETLAKDHIWNNSGNVTQEDGMVVPVAPGGELETGAVSTDHDFSFSAIEEFDAAFDNEIAAGNYKGSYVGIYTGNGSFDDMWSGFCSWAGTRMYELNNWSSYSTSGDPSTNAFTLYVTWIDPDDYIRIEEGLLILSVGETCSVTPLEYYPASNAFTWTSSNKNVATVTASYSADTGLVAEVTAVAEGTATITVTSADGLSDSFTVTVLSGFEPDFDLTYSEASDGIVLEWNLIPGVTEYQVMCKSGGVATQLGTVTDDDFTVYTDDLPGESNELYIVGVRKAGGSVAATYTSNSVNYGSVEFAIYLPTGLTVIEKEAFAGDSTLTSVYIHNGLTSIGDGAFKNCTGLTAVRIPGSCGYIGSGAFDGTDLTYAYVDRDTYVSAWFEENMPEVTLIYN